jgi:hypothetical protein
MDKTAGAYTKLNKLPLSIPTPQLYRLAATGDRRGHRHGPVQGAPAVVGPDRGSLVAISLEVAD